VSFAPLAWGAVVLVLWGIACYARGYKDGRMDERLYSVKPLRLVKKRAAER
jgi:hypothetical protein